jgi:hypothetical protein
MAEAYPSEPQPVNNPHEIAMEQLITALDRLGPSHPHGLPLRPGFPLYRANGEALGNTKPGDRLAQSAAVVKPAAIPHIPQSVSVVEEWVQGLLLDDTGPIAEIYVLAAAVDVHGD